MQDFDKSTIASILFDHAPVSLDESDLALLTRGHQLLRRLASDHIIYGVNTGFGPMAAYAIPPRDYERLQYNLIRSHALGSGPPLSHRHVRAILLARLRALMTGRSGVVPETATLLAAMINAGIYPLIPEHGGVGASGDLVQLAHVALAMIGEGEVFHRGRRVAASQALAAEGLTPLRPVLREGLAILNGTSAMTGIGLGAAFDAERAFQWALLGGALMQEIVGAYADAFSDALSKAKRHEGQRSLAKRLTGLLEGSARIRTRHLPLNEPLQPGHLIEDKVQDYYSIRCLPQILGPIAEAIDHAFDVLIAEFNSANDNPVLDLDTGEVLHGGNFHGEYVAQEMDKLKLSIVKLSMLCERQLNYLLNDRLNGILPPFLNLGTPGINLGLQGVQFTATSTVAENQSLAFPVSLHSIPCNKDNQDVVSMGSNAALLCQRVVSNTFEVLGIEWLGLLNAVDALGISEALAPSTRAVYHRLRGIVPAFREDELTSAHVAALVEHLKSHAP